MLPGDRLICAFVGQRAAGVVFGDWFLHVTDQRAAALEAGDRITVSELALVEQLGGSKRISATIQLHHA